MVWQQVPLDRIYYDDVTGVPGTLWPIGTPEVPSDVIADIITMCAARNLRKIEVHGAVTLGDLMEHYCFFGHEHEDVADQVSLGGQDVDGSHMEGLVVTGAQGGDGNLTLIRCVINTLTVFNGMMRDCGFYAGAHSFKDAGYVDLIDCVSVYGAVTITVQAPTRASIKNWKGNLVLTAQDGGLCYVRGFKGTLEIDAMTLGTLNVYANGATIQINGDCSGGTINIYGNANVTGAGGGVSINNYTLDVRTDRALYTLDFWSLPQEEVALTIAAADKGLPSVTVAELPAGATIVRAIAMFKFRMVENHTYAGVNSLDGAQEIQVAASVSAINFVTGQFTLAETTREGGDVIIGLIDIAGTVNANGAYAFHWDLAKALQTGIKFNDIQMGIRIWYSI